MAKQAVLPVADRADASWFNAKECDAFNYGNFFTNKDSSLSILCKGIVKDLEKQDSESCEEPVWFIPSSPRKTISPNYKSDRFQGSSYRQLEQRTKADIAPENSLDYYDHSLPFYSEHIVTTKEDIKTIESYEDEEFEKKLQKKKEFYKQKVMQEKERLTNLRRERAWRVSGTVKSGSYDVFKNVTSDAAEGQELQKKSASSPQKHLKSLCDMFDLPYIDEKKDVELNAKKITKTISPKQSLPTTLEPLRPWLTVGVPTAITGIDPENCLVFLPSLLRLDDWQDLPELSEEIMVTSDSPPSPRVISPTLKKYEHPHGLRQYPNTIWSCKHRRAPRKNIIIIDGKPQYTSNQRQRDVNTVRDEIRLLEGLMLGEKSNFTSNIVSQYLADIPLLRKISQSFADLSRPYQPVCSTCGRINFLSYWKTWLQKNPDIGTSQEDMIEPQTLPEDQDSTMELLGQQQEMTKMEAGLNDDADQQLASIELSAPRMDLSTTESKEDHLDSECLAYSSAMLSLPRASSTSLEDMPSLVVRLPSSQLAEEPLDDVDHENSYKMESLPPVFKFRYSHRK